MHVAGPLVLATLAPLLLVAALVAGPGSPARATVGVSVVGTGTGLRVVCVSANSGFRMFSWSER